MRQNFIKAVGQLQELFQELFDQGKIDPDQAERYNQAQKNIVNYDAWVQNQDTVKMKVDLPWDDEAFEAIWAEWKEYLRKKHVFTYFEASERITLESLHKLANGNVSTAIAIVKQSLGAGWKTFYELKSEKHYKNKRSKPGQILTSENPKEYDGWDD